jgi:hypothetical protein
MTDKKKRERVVAEITLAHLTQIAREQGQCLSPEEALTFLNEDGRAYDMWKHMMLAGEEYIKTHLERPHGGVLPRQFSKRERISA